MDFTEIQAIAFFTSKMQNFIMACITSKFFFLYLNVFFIYIIDSKVP